MKYLFILSLIISGQLKAQEIIVDPNAEARSLTSNFNAIKISGGIDLYLSQSALEGLAVSASEDKFISGIVTVVKNNTLEISYDGNRSLRNKKIKAYVSFTALQKLQASGASDVFVAGSIKGKELRLVLSGASDFKGMVDVETLRLDMSGASEIKVGGIATKVIINTSGASDVHAEGLETDFCDASASGASDVVVTVNKEITANARGASEITFKGNGVIKRMHASGASTVKRRN